MFCYLDFFLPLADQFLNCAHQLFITENTSLLFTILDNITGFFIIIISTNVATNSENAVLVYSVLACKFSICFWGYKPQNYRKCLENWTQAMGFVQFNFRIQARNPRLSFRVNEEK